MGEKASQQAVSSDAITREELVARAMQLVPMLRERAHEAEGLRRVPSSNVQALKAAGLFKTIQARRYGGYQMDLHRIWMWYPQSRGAVAPPAGVSASCRPIVG